jgi:DtxR family Mn-dependent transcriptional regulator
MTHTTPTQDNYLKAILALEREGKVSTNALAERLNTSAPTVTDMLKKLVSEGWIDYRPYYGASLTKKGQQRAGIIVRRHRLWEVFLTQRLGIPWGEVHPMAEELEHIAFDELTRRLDAYLGYPKFDPHGEPIPDEKGQWPEIEGHPLAEVPLQKWVTLVGVRSRMHGLLEFLSNQGVKMGGSLLVARKNSFDNSLEVRVKGKDTFVCSDEMAHQLYVMKK